MASAKIKKGDKVVVLSGKDKGKQGEVTKSIPRDGKVIVSGVNIITRHRKPMTRATSFAKARPSASKSRGRSRS